MPFKYYTYPGAGEVLQKRGLNQATVVDGIAYINGQGGWDENVHPLKDSPEQEIRKAFENVDAVMKAAGVKDGLASCFKFVIYLTDVTWWDLIPDILKDLFGPSFPLLTVIGVKALALDTMGIEIDAVAKV